MPTYFTYETRSEYMDSTSSIVTANAEYLGPDTILVSVNKSTGHFSIEHFPDINDPDSVPVLPDPVEYDDGEQTRKYIMLDKNNDNHIVLMDMLSDQVDVNSPTAPAVTEIIRTHTFSDESTFQFRKRNPQYQDTCHSFDLNHTTINANGVVTYVRFGDNADTVGRWLYDDDLKHQLHLAKESYIALYENTFLATQKEVYRKVVELHDLMIYDLVDKVPNWKLVPPTPFDVTQGYTLAEFERDTENWSWGTLVDRNSDYA